MALFNLVSFVIFFFFLENTWFAPSSQLLTIICLKNQALQFSAPRGRSRAPCCSEPLQPSGAGRFAGLQAGCVGLSVQSLTYFRRGLEETGYFSKNGSGWLQVLSKRGTAVHRFKASTGIMVYMPWEQNLE